jgi:tetratricopeptide (TPR) repeat protein
MKELIDRNKGDERLIDRYNQLRKAGKREATPARELPAEAIAEAEILAEAPRMEAPIESGSASASIMESAPEAPARAADEGYDEETQRYIAQALTDVDLFSSYGLTQKATTLLENVLVRAPRHTPTLERLLDLCLGAANERRTAELAALLEQIHRERQDTVNTERFAELRQRFQKLAGVPVEELPAAPKTPAPVAVTPVPPAAPAAHGSHEPATIELDPVVEPEAPSSAPMEFEIPLSTVETEAAAAEPLDPPVAPEPAAVAASGPTEEVDLSDEWEAMVQEVAEPAAAAHAPEPEEIAIPVPEPVPAETPATASMEEERLEIEVPAEEIIVEPVETAQAAALPVEMEFEIPEAVIVPELTIEPMAMDTAAEPEAIEAVAEPGPEAEPVELVVEQAAQEPAGEFALDPAFEVIEEAAASVPTPEPEPAAAPNVDFELELTPDPAAAGKNGAATTEDFLSELAAEIDDLETPAAAVPNAAAPAAPVHTPPPPSQPVQHVSVAAAANVPPAETAPAAAPTAETLNELAEVFQEFRSELGEIDDGDEDLETHYNLGIAYREMGLLDEAIGEFQKVAKAVQKGKPFQYSMNCATLLAISFMDKGEPKIASLWYQRALDMPGLDQEAVMALRYDLALALDMAGEADAALDSFRQVYAMNIDYRDVADRIATLQKH